MLVVHVLRKPIPKGSTVAKNVLEHGTGSINIDASRIRTEDNLNGGAYSKGASDRWDGAENWRYKRGTLGNLGEFQSPSGRWPSNFILEHKAGCVCVGEKKVNGQKDRVAHKRQTSHALQGGWSVGVGEPLHGHADENGQETVAEWECEAGCPVAKLENQAESSRFFKQVQSDTADSVGS